MSDRERLIMLMLDYQLMKARQNFEMWQEIERLLRWSGIAFLALVLVVFALFLYMD